MRIMKEIGWTTEWGGGVAHSFTGTAEEMTELVSTLPFINRHELMVWALGEHGPSHWREWLLSQDG